MGLITATVVASANLGFMGLVDIMPCFGVGGLRIEAFDFFEKKEPGAIRKFAKMTRSKRHKTPLSSFRIFYEYSNIKSFLCNFQRISTPKIHRCFKHLTNITL